MIGFSIILSTTRHEDDEDKKVRIRMMMRMGLGTSIPGPETFGPHYGVQ